MSPTDQLAAQLQAFFAGHSDSLETIARLSQDELVRMIRAAISKQTAHRDRNVFLEPQEICQCVYVTLLRLRERSSQPPVHNVLAYLQRLINNAVLERRRRNIAQRRSGGRFRSLDPQDLCVDDRGAAREAPIERREFTREIVQRLDAAERRVVLLRVHGWNWREIGIRLGGTPDSCRSTYRRAIARVRRLTKSHR